MGSFKNGGNLLEEEHYGSTEPNAITALEDCINMLSWNSEGKTTQHGLYALWHTIHKPKTYNKL